MKVFIALSALLVVAAARPDGGAHAHAHAHEPAIVAEPVVVAAPAPYHPAPAPAYAPAPAPYHPAPAYKPSSYAEPAYPDTAPAYNYAYAVADSYGPNFNQQESRDGYATKGEYRVALPDGRTQIVYYTVADDYSGYVADVKYEGEAVYPEYKPAAPYKAAPAYAPAPAPYPA